MLGISLKQLRNFKILFFLNEGKKNTIKYINLIIETQ